MDKDLVLTTEDISKDIIKKDGRFNPIITRAGDPNAMAMKTITEEKLNEIAKFMPEVNRSISSFSKKNSQTTSSLMSLTMIDSGPYRTLRQILAQIDRKQGALKENMYDREEKKVEYKRLQKQLDKVAGETHITIDGEIIEVMDDEDADHVRELIQIKMDRIASDIVDVTSYVEASLKELGAYMERYKEVRENNGIPKDWDEEDFEEAEIEHHIKTMYRNAVRDFIVTAGRGNHGTFEYCEQYGIHEIVMMREVSGYVREIDRMIDAGEEVTIDTHYSFLDAMYEKHKDDYKMAMKRIGLNNIHYSEWLMKENA